MWKPEKTVAQKDRVKEERRKMDEKILGEGPEEREKTKKKGKRHKSYESVKGFQMHSVYV